MEAYKMYVAEFDSHVIIMWPTFWFIM